MSFLQVVIALCSLPVTTSERLSCFDYVESCAASEDLRDFKFDMPPPEGFFEVPCFRKWMGA